MNDLVGVAVTIPLIVLLIAQELIAAGYNGRLRALTRCLRIATVPLMTTFTLIVIMEIKEMLDETTTIP